MELNRGDGSPREVDECDNCWLGVWAFPPPDLGHPQPIQAILRLWRIIQGKDSVSMAVIGEGEKETLTKILEFYSGDSPKIMSGTFRRGATRGEIIQYADYSWNVYDSIATILNWNDRRDVHRTIPEEKRWRRWAEVFTYIQSPSLKQVLAFGRLLERGSSGLSLVRPVIPGYCCLHGDGQKNMARSLQCHWTGVRSIISIIYTM